MKSEHRHHLAENDLEHRLGELAEKLKPYAKHILFGTLGVSIAAIVVVVMLRNANAADSDAWTEFTRCENANQYIEVAVQYPDSAVAHWAYVNAGEMLLHNGVELAFTHRTAAISDLEKAQDAFNEVLNDSSASLDVRERAFSGLARTLETLSDGDTQPAIDAYQEFLVEFPDSRHRRWAEDRIHVLEQQSTQEFYAWFQAQNPDPADRPMPEDPHAGLPGFGPLLDPLSEGSEFPFAPSDDTDPAPGEMDAPESTEGEPIEEGATPESGESADGPSLGPPTTDGADAESSETPDSSEAAPADGDATSETPAPPAGDDAPTTEEPASDTPAETPVDEAESTESVDPS